MPPDVVLISAYPPPGARHAGRSGVASYTSNLARALTASGASVVVVAPREDGCPDRFSDDGVDVRYASPRGPLALGRSVLAARSTGARVAHLQHEMFLYGGAASAATLSPALAWLRRTAGVAVTMHQVIDPTEIDRGFVRMHHVRMSPALARLGIRAVNESVSRQADVVVVHEPRFQVQFRRASVIPHGVESRQTADRATARQRLDLGEKPVVLCFGFLAPYKGLETALEAADLAEGSFDLVVAGGNHPRAPDYGERLRGQPRASVRFTGHVPESDISGLFAACDVALFPYPRPFSSSGAVALALAHRTPVLLSAPMAECMQASHDLVAPLDPQPLARRLTSITRSPRAIDQLRRASDALARGRRWDTVAKRHLELYEEVTDVRRPVGRSVRSAQPR